MPSSKQFADLLTAFRFTFAGMLALLGIGRDRSSLGLALYLILGSWISDFLDGTLARRTQPLRDSWLGDHDLIIDMAASTGLLVYLTGAGFLAPAFSLSYVVAWLFIFWQIGVSKSTGSLFQAPVYGLFLWVAIRRVPKIAVLALYLIAGMLLLSWRRFLFQVVPEFLHGISAALRRRAH